MVKTENGNVEYDGDIITLTADVGTLVVAIRDLICEQCPYPEMQEKMQKAYEASILRVLAMPIGQSDKERQKGSKNP